MSFDKQNVLDEIDAVMARWGASADQPRPKTSSSGIMAGNAAEASTACLALIERLAPGTEYERSAHRIIDHGSLGRTSTVIQLLGVLASLRKDVAAGFVTSLRELIHADVFADFLEMAKELLDKNFKDPAAVLAGSVLEEHLRKLAVKFGVDAEKPDGTPRKADTINADLVKVGVYNKLEQKSVVAWLDLRNKAAHGEYAEYDNRQVDSLVRDIRSFLTRHAA